MPRDPYIREKFTKTRNSARRAMSQFEVAVTTSFAGSADVSLETVINRWQIELEDSDNTGSNMLPGDFAVSPVLCHDFCNRHQPAVIGRYEKSIRNAYDALAMDFDLTD